MICGEKHQKSRNYGHVTKHIFRTGIPTHYFGNLNKQKKNGNFQQNLPVVVVVVVLLLFYVHGKHLRSCRDGQLT